MHESATSNGNDSEKKEEREKAGETAEDKEAPAESAEGTEKVDTLTAPTETKEEEIDDDEKGTSDSTATASDGMQIRHRLRRNSRSS